MKEIIAVILIGLISCNGLNKIRLSIDTVDSIEVLVLGSKKPIPMKKEFERKFLNDLIDSKNVGPTKYIKTHQILIHHSNDLIDTILTNGTIHQFNGWYKTDDNIIEKYQQ